MTIISRKEFSKATGLHKIPMPGLTALMMRLMKIDALNRLIGNASALEGPGFAARLLANLGISIGLDEKDLANIPAKGPFIVVANHPYGAVEALVLLHILCSKRPDTLFMGNFLLKKIPNLADYIIAVNPFETVDNKSSISGIKNILRLLKDGTPVGIFPAGEVSSFKPSKQRITDRKWHPVVGKIIAKAGVPVVPVYFHGNNGLWFSILRFLHPSLQTAKLPSELFNKQGHVLKMRIGKALLPADVPGGENSSILLGYCRARTYALGAGLDDEPRIFKPGELFKVKKEPQPVVAETFWDVLETEIANISEYRISVEKNYETYLAPSSAIPVILKEIGRLREVTFREVGEGTNKSIDLDRFDIYYSHLFLWDTTAKMLVGAYRIGKGDEIFYGMGKKGLYLSELFRLKKGITPLLKKSLELGRSWVRKEYQQKPLPLFLLWKGVLCFLQSNPRYRYLVGPVSISNRYSKFSRSLMVEYITRNHFNHELAGYVKARKKFTPDFSGIDREILLENRGSIRDLDQLIAELEPGHLKVPVLLRQYISLNAWFIGFNRDPKFCDALDGFLVLDLEKVPEAKLDRLS
ncbi:lysophospholipid acyltransferase family protein [Hufsiella ginkgonis]|uniref:GNAT family N-acetyltransferase n=1 Tax=Hufsiella ginkgonis TaxID=2695274 RepID=A0A7K1XXB1_9SPHI|nr:lysophospholipid acyltransferase family protein [Hufsiella ginkgonis]MXV15630.1 GNAT family N-acetyltransferase [Hufsiella ginkgonis]